MDKSQTTFSKKSVLLQLILCVTILLSGIQLKAQTVLFSEDWSSSFFSTNNWTFSPSQGNWQIGGNWQPGGATYPNAYFHWSPSLSYYSHALVSPIINGTNFTNLFLDYKLRLDNYSSASFEQFNVEYKKVTDTVWTILNSYNNGSGSFSVSPTNISLGALNTSQFQIRFVAFGVNSYNLNGWGLDDIIIKGYAAQNCSGQPIAGTISGPSSPVCPNIPVFISNTGYSIGLGMTYQWIASPQGANNWGLIPPATAPMLNATGGIPMSLDFRLVVTCANSGLTDTSNMVSITVLPFNQCYCVPGTTNPYASDHILNVTFAGINNSTGAGNASGYNDYSQTVAPAMVYLGQNYTVSILINYGGTEYGGIWIDFDQNGIFDSYEFINMGSGANPTFLTQNVNIPVNAVTGITKMRVRSKYGSPLAATDACAGYTYGETEDYSVNITAPTPCSGTPNSATALAFSVVCVNQPFIIGDTTTSTGFGITFSWESSPSGQNNWSVVPNATTNIYQHPGVAVATDFRLIVTCTSSSLSSTSNTVTVTPNPLITPNANISVSANNICSGTNVTFTSTTSGGGLNPTYQWKVNGWNVGGETNSTFTANWLNNGDIVMLDYTTSEQCYTQHTVTSNGIQMNVTQTVFPWVQIAASANPICVGTNVTFSITNSFGGGLNPTYQWFLNGQAIVGETNTTYNSSLINNSDYLYVEMTTSTTCYTQLVAQSNWAWMNVYQYTTPSVTLSNNLGSNTACVGADIYVYANPVNAGNASYQWYLNGSPLSGETNWYYHSLAINNNDSIWVEVTANALCLLATTAISDPMVFTILPLVTPTASIVADTTSICSGTAVTFTATTSNGGANPWFGWQINGNIVAWGSTTYAPTYLSNGDVVSLLYYTSEQCYTNQTAQSNGIAINVTQTVNPAISISTNDQTSCQGTLVTFTSNGSGGGLTPGYQWFLNGVAVAGETNSSYSSTNFINGDVVTLEYTTSEICYNTQTATSNWIPLTVYPYTTPTANIFGNANICAGTISSFWSNVNYSGWNPGYQWFVNGTPIAGETSATFTPSGLVNGDQISMQVTSDFLCNTVPTAMSDTITMNVMPIVTPTISLTSNTNNICSGTSVTFTTTSSGGGSNPSYLWSINGYQFWWSDTYTSTFLNNGDVVSVTLWTSEQCFTSQTGVSNTVTMNVTPTVTPTVNINTNNPTSCQGSLVTFTSNANGGGMTPSYQWYLNGVAIAGATNDTYGSNSFNNGDVVNLELTTSASCYTVQNATSNAIQLQVIPVTTPTATITTNSMSVCAGSNVTFFSNTSNTGWNPSYQWLLNGIAINGETNSTYSTSGLANNDQVSLEFTSSELCLTVNIVTSNTLTMIVNANVTPTASISESANNVCSGLPITFTATTSGGGSNPNYGWMINGNIVAWGNASYTNNSFSNGDVVSLAFYTSEQCYTSQTALSNNITMNITQTVTPTITINESSNSICAGTAVGFLSNITNGGANPQYQWYLNGVAVAGAINAQYVSNTLNNGDQVYCELTSNAGCVSNANTNSNTVFMSVITPVTYYTDADGDNYGDANVSVTNCTGSPQGYVTDNTDCNDADPLQHPGQHWFTDNDGDSYGTGNEVVQCLRPLHGFLSNELASTTGDCDDNNANINPAAQKLTFSNSAGFNNNSLILPQSGSQTTNFQFEVVYTDINNQMPPAFFPRVYLDYEGNGIYNNANDRTVVMNEVDAADITTSDGKKYFATINNLPTGSDWQTSIKINNNGCMTNIGPFNYPDVLVQPDLEIFANDITFSVQHPAISSPLTVSAVVHNNSDFFANNFIVHLNNQYDPAAVYPDVTVISLAPHATTTVSWNITTPALPSWNPMQVTIDATNVIAESNELNNSAIRPFVNGNYNLPGGIHAYASVFPAVSYAYTNWLSIAGSAYYYGTAVPLADSSVAGATVNYTIVETGASFSTYTNSAGQFSTWFPSPGIPGIYHITGTVTDFTLTGTFSTTFEIIPSPQPCVLPELTSGITFTSGMLPYSNNVVQGTPIAGYFTIGNSGVSGTGVASIAAISQSGGTPLGANFNVPVLASGASFTSNFNNLVFNIPGTYSICVEADATNVVNECNEGNNTYCTTINVLPALPDIYPIAGPYGTYYSCNSSQPYFVVHNAGGVPTGPFDCKLIVKRNGIVDAVLTQTVLNIDPLSNVGITFPYNHPGDGVYEYELNCDWTNVVLESDETNNIGNYGQTLIPCKPDLSLQGCEEFDVQPEDPANAGNITLLATIQNTGNATANGPIQVNFNLSGGGSFAAFFNGNLAPYQTGQVTIQVPAILPATQTLTAFVDPLNAIDELNEANNIITGSMCHEYSPVPMCGWNFWGQTYTLNSTANLAVGILSTGLYDATQLKTRFFVSGPGIVGTVNLGDATLNHVQMTCGCPMGIVLPTNFVFNHVGVYTFTMVTDPDNVYTECDETNNTLVVQVTVTNLPDMRVLSQHIAPSKLNPQLNEPISLNVSYENIGLGNINDQMKLKVYVDNTPLATVSPVPGLPTGADNTVAIPYTWSSNIAGIHVIRAIIDADNQVVEDDEMNNEATRAVVVGSSANLYFQTFASQNPSPAIYTSNYIYGRVGNNGDLACAADVELYRVDNNLDTLWLSTLNINVPPHDSVNIQFPSWVVTDPSTVFVGKITNSSTLEYTYDDNTAFTEIGTMPVITITSTPSCVNDSNGTLTAVVNGGEPPYTYSWSNGYATSNIMAAAGSYTLTVTDLMNRTATATGIILDTVCQPVCNLTAHITASGPLALCSNGNVTLTATQGTSYLWSNGATTQSITVNAAGSYYAIVTDGNCSDTTETVTVIVKAMPSLVKIKVLGLATVCEPNSVSFRVDPSAANLYGFDFQWKIGGVAIAGATDTAYTASSAGGGSVTLTISGSNCTKTSAGKTYLIKPLPVAAFTAGSATTICAGGSVIFTAPTIQGYTYSWLKDGATNGSGTIKTVKLAGTYAVIAKLSGCADTSDPQSVIVNPLPLDSIVAATPVTFCAGDSCTLTAKPIDGTKYRWYLGVNPVDSTAVPTYIAKVAGTFKVMVTDQNGCVGKLSTTKVTTKVNPIPTPTITPSGTPVTIAANGNVKLKATPASGVTWQWYKDGVLIANATVSIYTATSAGNYTVAVTKLGCTGVSAATTVIQTGVREETATIGSVENNFEFVAYPNPVSNNLTVEIRGLDNVDAQIQLMDMNGRLLGNWQLNTTSLAIDMHEYASGIYLIRYKDADGRTGTLKVVKE